MVLVILGLFSWIFVEYFFHRFALHSLNILGDKHKDHHEKPKSKKDSFVGAKLVLSVSLIYCLIGLIFLSFGEVFFLYTGLVIGYFIYEFVHYRVHYCSIRNPLLKLLRNYHMKHHYKEVDKKFGVTSPLLDLVFGTYK